MSMIVVLTSPMLVVPIMTTTIIGIFSVAMMPAVIAVAIFGSDGKRYSKCRQVTQCPNDDSVHLTPHNLL